MRNIATRVRILRALKKTPTSTATLREYLNITANQVKYYLKEFRERGYIVSRAQKVKYFNPNMKIHEITTKGEGALKALEILRDFESE